MQDRDVLVSVLLRGTAASSVASAHQISDLLVPAPGGQQIPLSELATIKESTGASFIYRENNSRYIGIQFSVEGRDLETIVKSG
jgi:cobalt-zinc-cadmium resistance protein CzcA